MLVYATTTDLTAWTGQPAPANAAVLLREASTLVADATRADVYDTAPNGLPVDPDLVEALRDATCAHAALWAVLEVDPAAGPAGLGEVVTASSIDGASVSTNASELAAGKANSLEQLCSAARRVLRLAGLGSNLVTSW